MLSLQCASFAILASCFTLGDAMVRSGLSPQQQDLFDERVFAEQTRYPPAAAVYTHDADLVFDNAPGAWHQQLARIVDHRFISFDVLNAFALNAKKVV